VKPVNRVREERKAVGRLIDAFGADALVALNRPPELNSYERFRRRLAVEELIEGCTACPLHASQGGATERPLVPLWSPFRAPRAGRAVVVTDAPSMQEHRLGELGHGPLYQTVRGELRANGLDSDVVTYVTTVACTPITTDRRGTRRTPPEPKDAATCTANLMASLAAADVDYVLLLGGHAVRAWRKQLSVEQTAGRWFVWNSRWMVFVAEHPSVLLTRSKSAAASNWQQHIAKFCLGVHDRVGLEVLSGGCIKPECHAGTGAYDDDGVPWCTEHFKPGKATRETRKVKLTDTAQGQLM